MDEGRYIVRMLPDNRSSVRPLEYANGVLDRGQQTAQPTLQISYNQLAYQRQSVGVQPVVSGGSPILYHANRLSYGLYQEQAARVESSSTYISTTIPRASAAGPALQTAPSELANSAQYMVVDQSQQPVVGVQYGAQPAIAAPPSAGVVLSQTELVRTTAEVHRSDLTEETAATTHVTGVRASNSTDQNLTDDLSAKHSADLAATRSKARQQKPKADSQKANKQIPAAKVNGVKERGREGKARLTENGTKGSQTRNGGLDADEIEEFDRTKSLPRVSLANDIFVEQVQAARQAHKNTKSTARRRKPTEKTSEGRKSVQVAGGGQTTKTRVQAEQTGHGERRKTKTRTISTQTQTDGTDVENQPKRVMTNTAEVQTEVVPVNERDVDDHVGQDQVMWTAGGTQTEADPEESVKDFDGTLSSSLGQNVYARVIKSHGAISTTLERSDTEHLTQTLPPIPTKSDQSFQMDSESSVNDGDVFNITTEEDHEQTVNGTQDAGLLTQKQNASARNTEQNLPTSEDNKTTGENVDQNENPYSLLTEVSNDGDRASHARSNQSDVHEQLTETDTSERPGGGGMVDESAADDTRSADQETVASSTSSREPPKDDRRREKSAAPSLPAGFLLNGSIKVYFHCCDITKLKTYVIVSSATTKLKHEHGVAKALAKAGGKDLEKDSKKYVKKNGPVAVAEVVSTRPGKLQCAHVFHAVGPVFKDYSDKNECRMKLRQTYDNIFDACNLHKVPSIAIPLISTGRFGVPYQYIASCLYEALVTAAANTNSKYPKEVHVVNLESAVILPVVVSFSTQQVEVVGKAIEVQPLDKREVRDVLRERVVHKKSVSSVVKKVKERTTDTRKSNKKS